ncbi:MAG: hypothetical protein ABEH83_04120 [Halobacterium sp.]
MSAVLALFVVVALAAPLVLYALVRREAEDTERMGREEARERVSRERDE